MSQDKLFISDSNLPVQTRNEEGGLRYFSTVQEAIDHAKKDSTVWKISFSFGNERLRLIRNIDRLGSEKDDLMIGPWTLDGTQGAMSAETQEYIRQKESDS